MFLDAANLGMAGGAMFMKHVERCIDFWSKLGFLVVAILGGFSLQAERSEKCKVVQDPDVAFSLWGRGQLFVPPSVVDLDDYFCIRFSMKYNAYFVTNDQLQDHKRVSVAGAQFYSRRRKAFVSAIDYYKEIEGRPGWQDYNWRLEFDETARSSHTPKYWNALHAVVEAK